MPWKYNGAEVQLGRSWTDNSNIKHPSNWFLWSDSEKSDKGLVWAAQDSAYDNRFYWAAGIERQLTDSSDGTPGLKTNWKNNSKKVANGLLSNTDWMIVRYAEDSSRTIPSSITNFRNSVRTACSDIEAKIDACNNMTQFKALFESTNEGKTPAVIHNWPMEDSSR